ncbi:MAG: peptidoglycan bridge formation glycyltransferase FemA/FemB family protein [Bacteroidota bacterium]
MKLLSHLNSSDRDQLSALNNNELPIQFLPEFANFYQDFYQVQLNIVFSERLEAYIPFRIQKAKTFRLGQILHAPVDSNTFKELSSKDQLIFFNAFIRYLKENNLCERLIQPHPYGILGALPPSAQSCEFGTYITDLANQTVEEIFNNFNPKYQKAIHHSEKHGAVVRSGWELFDDFYETYHATMQRVHLAADSRNYFQKLYEHLGEKHVTIGVVYDDGKPIGSVFFIHTNYAGYCTHAGSQGESKLYGAVKLLHYEMMKLLKEKSVKRYDLVGVRLKNKNPALEGIFRFKKGFGGELKTGYLWKKDINPVKAKLYDVLRNIKTNKELTKDIIDQENE